MSRNTPSGFSDAAGLENAPVRTGPYITISRQHGCHAWMLGLMLAEILNDQSSPDFSWRVYGREVLEQLAVETKLDPLRLEELHSRQPRVMEGLLETVLDRPSRREIRARVEQIIRRLAIAGRAIIIGQGGFGATADIGNGLSVSLEAPLDWRVVEVCKSHGITPLQARSRIRRQEKEREYIRKIYAMRMKRTPLFDIVYDNSRFTPTELAQHVVAMMRIRKMI